MKDFFGPDSYRDRAFLFRILQYQYPVKNDLDRLILRSCSNPDLGLIVKLKYL